MGNPYLVVGKSGSGKSTSIELLDPNATGVFEVASKRLPFRSQLPVINHADYNMIYKVFSKAAETKKWKKIYVIDDSQYLMAFEAFNRAKETGYQKFTDLAVNFYNLIKYVIEYLPDDVNVYFLHHTEQTETGEIKAKTLGKMIDNQLTLEGLFTVVLYAQTDGKRYWFSTQSDGYTTAKSPKGMFPPEIDNDLAYVDRTIREYYNMTPIEGENNNEQEKTA
ncbi:MAG: AAA family ATPase [Erysipelotrichaceae bacterium]|nr:AAA family ATPase [Erysipelotrichaceae bacterium]